MWKNEEELRASEAACRAAPADKDGIWVNVSETQGVLGNVYSNRQWAEHYARGDERVQSVRYVPETVLKECMLRLLRLMPIAQAVEAALAQAQVVYGASEDPKELDAADIAAMRMLRERVVLLLAGASKS